VIKHEGYKVRFQEGLREILDATLEYIRHEKSAAILVPIMLTERPKLVMILRSKNLSRSAGHVAFPGGIREVDETPLDTALRESEEEIGVEADKIEVLGFLSPKEVIEHRIKIHPVVGVMGETELKPDDYEVSKILVDDLKKVLLSRRITDWGPNFECDGELIWGASSRILDDFYLRIIRRFGSIEKFFSSIHL